MKVFIRIVALLLTFCVLNPFRAFSQFDHPDYQITNLTVEDGLPSNECHEIIQTRSGMIFIATNNGLAKYDGQNFTRYGVNEGLGDLVCIQLQEDINGNIWINTEGANMYIYDVSLDSVYPYKYNHLLQDYRQYWRTISTFYIDGELTFHVGVSGFGVVSITSNGEVSEFRRFYDDRYIYELVDIENNFVLHINFYDECGNVHPIAESNLQYIDGDIYDSSYVKCSEFIHLIPFVPDGMPVLGIHISQLKEGEYIVYNRGCNMLVDSSGRFTIIGGKPILTAKYCSDSTLLIGRYNGGGLQLVNYTDSLLNTYQTLLDDVSVTDVELGVGGGIFVATLNRGIFILKRKHFKFFELPLNETNLFVKYLSFDQDSSLIISSTQQCYIVDRHVGYIPIFESEQDVHCVSDVRGYTLVGGQSSTYKIEGDQALRLERKNSSGESIYAKKITGVAHTSGMIIMMNSNSYYLYDLDMDSVYFDYYQKTRLSNTKFNDVILYDGRILCATDTGLVIVNEDLSLSRFKMGTQSKGKVNSISWNDSLLVIGTPSSGIEIIKDDGHYIRNTVSGLVDNAIIEVKIIDNYIFALTYRGFSVIPVTSDFRAIYSFTRNDGLFSNSVTDVDLYNDSLFICSGGRVQSVSLELLEPKSTQVHLSVKDYRSYNYLSNVRYDFDEDIEIGYRTQSQSEGHVNNYRYKLNNTTWTLTERTSATFTSLKPDTYQFEVQVRQNDSSWSEPAYLLFQVLPPWYRSVWFYTILGGFSILTFYLLLRYRFKVRERNLRIQNEMARLERKALKAQMNPHFVFNCLNSIQNFIMKNERESAMLYLSQLARLIRSTLKYSDQAVIGLDEEVEMMTQYLELEKMRFRSRFSFELVVENSSSKSVCMPPMLVQPFVENAIIHGMKDLSGKGLIEVRYLVGEDDLEVTIRDNGSGFDLVSESNPRSQGMRITRQRLKVLNSDDTGVLVQSAIGVGTVVKITIRKPNIVPLGRSTQS